MNRTLRILAAVVLCVVLASYAVAAVTAGMGQRALLTRSQRVDAGYQHWICERNIIGVNPSPTTLNVNRYNMHHSLTISGTLIPVRRVDLMHTATGAVDTLTLRFYNAGIADSVHVIAPAAVTYYSFPLYGDSLAIKPFRASLAGDWIITTFFGR